MKCRAINHKQILGATVLGNATLVILHRHIEGLVDLWPLPIMLAPCLRMCLGLWPGTYVRIHSKALCVYPLFQIVEEMGEGIS